MPSSSSSKAKRCSTCSSFWLANQFSDLDKTVISDVDESTTIPWSPEWNSSTSLILDFPTRNGVFTIRGDVFYKGETFIQLVHDPNLHQESYTLFNARATYVAGEGNWEISVFGTNLSDEQWIRYGFGGALFGQLNMTPGDPRVWGVSAQYRF